MWLVAVVLIVGLLLIWLYDKIGGTFLPRPWKIVLLIIFAILAALTRVPEYIHDLRKIDLGAPAPSQEAPKEKPYAAQLAHAHEEGLLDENNRLQVPRSDFVRFCVKNEYFRPHRKLKKAEQLGYKPSSGSQCPVPFRPCVEQAEQEDGSDLFD